MVHPLIVHLWASYIPFSIQVLEPMSCKLVVRHRWNQFYPFVNSNFSLALNIAKTSFDYTKFVCLNDFYGFLIAYCIMLNKWYTSSPSIIGVESLVNS